MRTWNRTAVVVLPKQPFLDWLHSADPTSRNLTLQDLAEDPSVYMIPEALDDSWATHFLTSSCGDIFEEQLAGWYTDEDVWPKDLSFDIFKQWYQYSFHYMVIDLSDEPLIFEEM